MALLKTKSPGWGVWSIRAWGRAFYTPAGMLCSVAIWNYGEIPFVVNHSGIRRGAQTFQKRPRRHGNVNTDFITTRCEVCRKTRYLHFAAFLLAFTVCILTFPCLRNSWQTCWFCATLDTCVSSADGVCGLCFPRSCMLCRAAHALVSVYRPSNVVSDFILQVVLSCHFLSSLAVLPFDYRHFCSTQTGGA